MTAPATSWRAANSAAAPRASNTDNPVSRFGVAALKRAARADSGTAKGSITNTVQQASRSLIVTPPDDASSRGERRPRRAISLFVALPSVRVARAVDMRISLPIHGPAHTERSPAGGRVRG